ncbi:MAG: hypothetical protein LBE02_02700 [Spirochaetaceae bacterium]|jgi:hypothetical protein|nr:hypothetical protein [Spirochaetaceae bacterium]
MKKFIICLVMALSLTGLFAQNGQWGSGNFRNLPPSGAPEIETVTVTGNLVLSNGRIALKSGDELYYVGGIQRLVGFVEGLKEGARVSLEGYVFKGPGEEAAGFLVPTKLTIGDRVYDIPRPPEAGRPFGAGRPSEGYGPRHGCFGPRDRFDRDREPRSGASERRRSGSRPAPRR